MRKFLGFMGKNPRVPEGSMVRINDLIHRYFWGVFNKIKNFQGVSLLSYKMKNFGDFWISEGLWNITIISSIEGDPVCGSALNGMALIRLSAENYLSVEADLQYNTYNWHHKLAQSVHLWKTSSIVFNIIPGTDFDFNSVQERI